jgi:hypothetical protein
MSTLRPTAAAAGRTEAVGPATRAAPVWLVAADLLAKTLLFLAVARVAVDPGWGNLEGKAPGTRALTYPMLALLVPALHLATRRGRPYPWGADLLVTVPAFSDVLGNRFDLYDRVVWFDDAMHLVSTAALSAAVLLLTGTDRASFRHRVQLAVAVGVTLSLAWELWEFYAFVTRSGEASTAYADTLGDLVLGWAGAVLAAVLVRPPGRIRRRRHEGTRAPGRRDL